METHINHDQINCEQGVTIFTPLCKLISSDSFLLNKPERCFRPFADELKKIVSSLGQEILRSPVLKADTGAVALAYWLRNANVERLQREYFNHHTLNASVITVPVGKVLHLTPANVDTIFLYSWALSFLCGNQNIVRVSSKPSHILQELISCVLRLMQVYPELADNNLFMTCEHNHNFLYRASSWCNHRVVWGGNEAIKMVRAIPMATHASERVFASKHSYAVFSIQSILESDTDDLANLVTSFYNDVFAFNQKACSSPHTIFWVGANDLYRQAITRFEDALEAYIKNRGRESSLSDMVIRFSQACDLVAKVDGAQVNLHAGAFTSLVLTEFDELKERDLCGRGFFRHLHVEELMQICEFLGGSDQTLTHYGFDHTSLQQLAVHAGMLGVDRLVAVGRALEFSPIWDGYDLISDFIRKVSLL